MPLSWMAEEMAEIWAGVMLRSASSVAVICVVRKSVIDGKGVTPFGVDSLRAVEELRRIRRR